MFDQRFFADKVGTAALASVVAMVAFNVVAISYNVDAAAAHDIVSVALHPVELA